MLTFQSYPNFSSIDEIELRTEAEERWKMGFLQRSGLFSALILLFLIQLNRNLDMIGRLVIIILRHLNSQVNRLSRSKLITKSRLESGANPIFQHSSASAQSSIKSMGLKLRYDGKVSEK